MTDTPTLEVLDDRLCALDRLVHIELQALSKEVELATHGVDDRLQNIYSSLDRIRDGLNAMLPRDVYDERHGAFESRLNLIERSQSRQIGIAAGAAAVITLMLGTVVGVVIHYFLVVNFT